MAKGKVDQAVGRNDPCPCGSGRKYKQCHGLSSTAMTGRGRALLFIAIGVFVGLLALAVSSRSTDAPGPLPGQVWSPEHGHYH